MNGHQFQSIWLPDRLRYFNLTRLLSSADIITVQTYRWDVFCMWLHSMHKRPILNGDFNDYSADHLIPTITYDTMLLLHELRHFAPTAQLALVNAPPPYMAPGFSFLHSLMAHPSSIAAAALALSAISVRMQDVQVLDWAAAAADLGVQCIDADGNHVRLECAAPLLRMIKTALLD